MHVVIVPGIGGSGPAHWQSLWEAEAAAGRDVPMTRIAPASWDRPALDDWCAAISRAVLAAGPEPVVVVAHSLGCLASAAWAVLAPAAETARVAGLFLVAPPDSGGPLFPPEAAGFARDELGPVGRPGVVVFSDDDVYCSPERAGELAGLWGLPALGVGRRGHVNDASGLGSWDEGRRLLTAFTAGLGLAP